MIRSLLNNTLKQVGSVWFGVSMLVVIFLYSSVGSALPPIRQGALGDWTGLEFLRFEKTEMQWFCWWPFQLMLALLCISLVVSTVRIRLSLVNAGVWTIHTGMLVLTISSAVYFAPKIEGDAVVFHSQAMVKTPGMSAPTSFVVRPEARGRVGVPGSQYDLRVAQIDPDYTIEEGAAKGESTAAIWMSVAPVGTSTRFARRFLLGHPELTEDFLIEANGVVRLSDRLAGHKLLDEQLQIQLWYDPVDQFYVADTSSVYARFSSDQPWRELRVRDMPQYFEHIDDTASIWTPAEGAPKMRPLDLPAGTKADQAALNGVDLRITGFLPYAEQRTEWVAGSGDAVNPLLRVRIKAPFAETTEHLLARIPSESSVRLPTGQNIAFSWATSGETLARMIERPVPRLTVKINSANLTKTIPLADLEGKGPVVVAGSGYSISLQRKLPAGAAGTSGPPSVLVQVSKPGGVQFNRLVFEGRGDGGLDLDAALAPSQQPADADIALNYADPWEDKLTLIATDDAGTIHAVRTTDDGGFAHLQGKLGDPINVTTGMSIVPEQILRNARQESRPAIVPNYQRQPGSLSREIFSQVHVEVRQGEWSKKVWLRFHDYAFENSQRAQPGRFRYEPVAVALPDGRQIELLYSRWRVPLPSPVALDRFVLKTHPGGDQPADYISHVRFLENGAWSDITEVRSNHPAQHGDYWYFQSQYDPQTQSHTVLGVGNRVAVGWMLAGVCISIAGMLYAFYVKPAVIRSRKRAEDRALGVPPEPRETRLSLDETVESNMVLERN